MSKVKKAGVVNEGGQIILELTRDGSAKEDLIILHNEDYDTVVGAIASARTQLARRDPAIPDPAEERLRIIEEKLERIQGRLDTFARGVQLLGRNLDSM